VGHGARTSTSALDVAVHPPSPFRLGRGSSDRTLRVDRGVATRLLHVDASPILVRAWQPAADRVLLRAEAIDPAALRRPPALADEQPARAGREQLLRAIERLRFALGVDEDMREFHLALRRDPLVGPLLRRLPRYRPLRTPWPWEALCSAVVKQLIESDRAARIERRIVGRWGARLGEGRAELRDVPSAATIAGRAPAELASMDLAPKRAEALRRVAREVASGRCTLEEPRSDRRLLSIPQIGPWTIQCLGLYGRGDMDSLPAGDLGYIKLVGHLAGLGRRATIEEVEEFYSSYEPFRGLVGSLTLAGLYRQIVQGRPLRLAA
jgi:3-methyladenine DNA glycosylase/8-oxoguanine DNA glycosylase